jgi:5-methylthioadenosine/S-adenosylhomocysteine deaminase
MEKEIGSLEAGKRADMVMVRIDRPHAIPLYNVYSQLVYALKGSDVQDVMINGATVVADGTPARLNSAAILAKAREFQRSIAASLNRK